MLFDYHYSLPNYSNISIKGYYILRNLESLPFNILHKELNRLYSFKNYVAIISTTKP